MLRVTHDIIDVNPDGDNSSDFPLALPEEFHRRILYYFHNSLWAMHMGWRKGIKLLRQRYYCYGMGAAADMWSAVCNAAERIARNPTAMG